MNDLIRATESGVVWPYNLAMLRRDEPERGFSDAPTDAQLAQYGVFRVVTAEPRLFDPATERVVEIQPELVGGVWVQRWEIVELTAEEQDAVFRAQNPPQWQAFGQAVWSNPTIGAVLRGGLQQDATAPLVFALPVGLGQAATSAEFATFINACRAAHQAGLLSAELLQVIIAHAVQFRLPAVFVNGLESIVEPG